MLKHNLHTSVSHKTQEKKVVQIIEANTGNKATVGAPITVTSVSQPSAFVDGNIPCQFRMENPGGQVTYRVIQVSDVRGKEGPLMCCPQPTSLEPSRLLHRQSCWRAYWRRSAVCIFPRSLCERGTATSMSMQPAGRFYVMMTPPDILHTASQRTINPRAHPYTVKMDSPRTPRDERRRAQHNEVERRRRDKINNWIVTLSKIIPDCSLDCTKSGTSKGGILSKACDYIKELKENNQRLQEILQGLEREQTVQDLLRQQLEKLKSENVLLRVQLKQHSIEMMTDAPAQ